MPTTFQFKVQHGVLSISQGHANGTATIGFEFESLADGKLYLLNMNIEELEKHHSVFTFEYAIAFDMTREPPHNVTVQVGPRPDQTVARVVYEINIAGRKRLITFNLPEKEYSSGESARIINLERQVRMYKRANEKLCEENTRLRDASAEVKTSTVAGDMDLLSFIKCTVSVAFRKIHAQFPHLTLDEIIAFEEALRSNGGSMMTHSGVFAPTIRCASEQKDLTFECVTVSWTCCHSVAHLKEKEFAIWPGREETCRKDRNIRHVHGGSRELGERGKRAPTDITPRTCVNPIDKASPDLLDPSPIGRCDSPISFSIVDNNFVNPGARTVAEMKDAVGKRINATQVYIGLATQNIAQLKGLQTALSIMADKADAPIGPLADPKK